MQVSSPDLSDYRWLTGSLAEKYLETAARHTGSLVGLIQSLRRDLGADRAHLVAELTELRRKAVAKFSRAPSMYFTRVGLEQSTDELIAAYKASRWSGEPVVDLCCGVGGDLIGLRGVGEARGVDFNPGTALLAEANCRVHGLPAPVTVADAYTLPVEPGQTWHLDPDRRPGGQRVTNLNACEPGPLLIQKLRERNPDGAVKLAPATQPDGVDDCEREWIGSRGECRQQVLWFGSLQRSQTTASVVREIGKVDRISGPADIPIDISEEAGRYLYEPHAAVLAAQLQGHLATQHGLRRLPASSAYLTCDELLSEPLLAAFQVEAQLPMDLKRLRSLLRERAIGRLEIKARGRRIDLPGLRTKLKLKGDESAVLILAAHQQKSLAILARRAEASQ